MRDASGIIFGRNPVSEAFRSDTTIERVFILKGSFDASINTIVKKARQRGIKPEFVSKDRLDEICEKQNHQGVVAYISEFKYYEVSEILDLADSRNEKPFIAILDGVEDPMNLGAIIRSANLLGLHGIIIPKRGAATLTSSCAKASAGAISFVRVARVTNIKNTIEELKEKGLWFVCADATGESMYQTDMTGPICLVMGGENKGISDMIKKTCDYCVSIPMKPIEIGVNSYNVANAFSIVGCEILKQREKL